MHAYQLSLWSSPITDAPRLIGDGLVNVTTTGREAELVCRVMANPPPRPSSVYWRRVNDEAITSSVSSGTKSNYEAFPVTSLSISDIKCNQVSSICQALLTKCRKVDTTFVI